MQALYREIHIVKKIHNAGNALKLLNLFYQFLNQLRDPGQGFAQKAANFWSLFNA